MTEKTVSFSELAASDFNVEAAAAVMRRWEDKNRNNYLANGRPENILSYTVTGRKRIYIPDREEPLISLDAPGAVLIGEGCPYLSETVALPDAEYGQTVCVRFRLTDENGCRLILQDTPLAFPDDAQRTLYRRFSAIFDCYIKPSFSHARLKAECYLLLSELFPLHGTEAVARGFENLMPAVRAIENNPAADIPVSELAHLCYLSESYFRSRFKLYSGGLSPAEYRNVLRITKARELLSSSLWTTDLIAETLGFYDTSHFYRIYKKYTGTTPKNRQKQ